MNNGKYVDSSMYCSTASPNTKPYKLLLTYRELKLAFLSNGFMLLFRSESSKVHVFVLCFQALHLHDTCIGVLAVFLRMMEGYCGIKPCQLVINCQLFGKAGSLHLHYYPEDGISKI